ncbi:MAG: hypothetical protein ACK52I_12455 [Pseudomonadota bacterium]
MNRGGGRHNQAGTPSAGSRVGDRMPPAVPRNAAIALRWVLRAPSPVPRPRARRYGATLRRPALAVRTAGAVVSSTATCHQKLAPVATPAGHGRPSDQRPCASNAAASVTSSDGTSVPPKRG